MFTLIIYNDNNKLRVKQILDLLISDQKSKWFEKEDLWEKFGKNIEADQSYFLAEVNNITRKTFEKSLAKIVPCSFAENGNDDQIETSSVRLDPTHDFVLENEILNTEITVKDLFPPSGRDGSDNDHF